MAMSCMPPLLTETEPPWMSVALKSICTGFGPLCIFVAIVAKQFSKGFIEKSFRDAVNDCEERVLTSTVEKHGVPKPRPVTSIPNSVKEFVGRVLITAAWLSKLFQPPFLMAAPLLKAQTKRSLLQPSPPTVSTRR